MTIQDVKLVLSHDVEELIEDVLIACGMSTSATDQMKARIEATIWRLVLTAVMASQALSNADH